VFSRLGSSLDPKGLDRRVRAFVLIFCRLCPLVHVPCTNVGLKCRYDTMLAHFLFGVVRPQRRNSNKDRRSGPVDYGVYASPSSLLSGYWASEHTATNRGMRFLLPWGGRSSFLEQLLHICTFLRVLTRPYPQRKTKEA